MEYRAETRKPTAWTSVSLSVPSVRDARLDGRPASMNGGKSAAGLASVSHAQSMARPAAPTQVLRAVWLREKANQMAYFDKARFATRDALLIGRLHTHMPLWAEANLRFIQSGGYTVRKL